MAFIISAPIENRKLMIYFLLIFWFLQIIHLVILLSPCHVYFAIKGLHIHELHKAAIGDPRPSLAHDLIIFRAKIIKMTPSWNTEIAMLTSQQLLITSPTNRLHLVIGCENNHPDANKYVVMETMQSPGSGVTRLFFSGTRMWRPK